MINQLKYNLYLLYISHILLEIFNIYYLIKE